MNDVNDITIIDLKAIILVGYSKIISCTKFYDFGIICFPVIVQTDRHTDVSSSSGVYE